MRWPGEHRTSGRVSAKTFQGPSSKFSNVYPLLSQGRPQAARLCSTCMQGRIISARKTAIREEPAGIPRPPVRVLYPNPRHLQGRIASARKAFLGGEKAGGW